MNATNLQELRGANGQVADEKLDQVREILFGEYQRRAEAHIVMLEERVRDLELSVHRRLDAIQARVDSLAAEVDAQNRSALDEIAQGMVELGDRVRRIQRP
ncbi:MAG: hypothetical protein AAFR70_05435 [Pseudomonadota bacterium]